ncbi:MAG: hypothetical protein FWH23_07330 [Bacteroidales bacterium]|nr:hypothetical protein [Bacteroidales bacterium]
MNNDIEFKNSLLELIIFFENLRKDNKLTKDLHYIECCRIFPIYQVVFNNQPFCSLHTPGVNTRNLEDAFSDGWEFIQNTKEGKKIVDTLFYFSAKYKIPSSQLIGYNVSMVAHNMNYKSYISDVVISTDNDFKQHLIFLKEKFETEMQRGPLEGGQMELYIHLQEIYCIVFLQQPLYFRQIDYVIPRCGCFTIFENYKFYPDIYQGSIDFLNSKMGKLYQDIISYFANYYEIDPKASADISSVR